MSAAQGSSDVVQQCVTRIFRCTTAAVGSGARMRAAGDAGAHAAQSCPLPTSSSTTAQILVGLSDQSETWLRCCEWPCAASTWPPCKTLALMLVRERRGAKLSSSASRPSFPERVGCCGRGAAHGRAGRRCQLSARFGTLVAVDTTPMRRPERARQSRSRRRMQGPRTPGLHSQGLPGSASSALQKVKLARGSGGADPIS